jgi:hypothetical protein
MMMAAKWSTVNQQRYQKVSVVVDHDAHPVRRPSTPILLVMRAQSPLQIFSFLSHHNQRTFPTALGKATVS